mmetsp:Transcript_28198/g.86161  ORF Transcript_28198/g.86161 Transcript_28198/m.86161 type:complete len:85 (+) Transcript_28198:81-335(+)
MTPGALTMLGARRAMTTRALNCDSATRLRSLLLGQPGMEMPFQVEKAGAARLQRANTIRLHKEARPFHPNFRPARWQAPRATTA